jgi:pSer/pThr/pTyr-binding forkhead associated (FHA) protein
VRSTRDAAPTAPVCWIAWGERRFPLGTGIHILGRDPDVDIRVDAATVSRRHARLVVAAAGVTLEDLGSKNGTFREGAPVTGAVALADGDAIGIGSLLLTFRLRGDDSTETLGWA